MSAHIPLSKALRLERMKIRGRGLYAIWALLTLAPLIWILYSQIRSADATNLMFEFPSVRYNVAILQDLQVLALFLPFTANLLISRMTEAEHQGRTWKMLIPAGQPVSSLWDAKFLIAYALMELTALLCLAASLGFVWLKYRIALPWAVVLLSYLTISAASLVTLTLAQIVAFVSSNQLIVLIEGVAGSLIGLISGLLPRVFAWILPWGLYIAGAPAGTEALGRAADGQMLWLYTAETPAYGLIFGIAVIYLILGLVVRSRLNRKEW